MPTEVTATVVIGPIHANSYHRQPDVDRKLFCPSHMLVLMEGPRATRIVQPCPLMGRGKLRRARIRRSDPHRLLHPSTTGEVAALLAKVLRADPEEIETLLLERRWSVLGAVPRPVFLRGAAVPWNPAND